MPNSSKIVIPTQEALIDDLKIASFDIRRNFEIELHYENGPKGGNTRGIEGSDGHKTR